jgi:hypothetical protein
VSEEETRTPGVQAHNGVPQKQALALDMFDEHASEHVRRVWHEGRWFFSILDTVAILTDSSQPSRYWTEWKQRILDEGFVQVFARCEKLKLLAADGKQRLTDCADSETLLRLIQSIPSPKQGLLFDLDASVDA